MRRLAWVLPSVAALAVSIATRAGEPSADDLAFFESKVRPILVARCYECHSAKAPKLKGGLKLDSKAGWVEGGDTGPALEPGKPDESLLVKAIRYDDPTIQMPPKGKMPEAEISALVEWVKRGAPDPRDASAQPEPQKSVDLEAGRNYWAFLPLEKIDPPALADDAWSRTPIDRFIRAKQSAAGLSPSIEAEKRVLIRRASLDITGLPPTPDEIDQFLLDSRADAYEHLIDRLLVSPRFGERWARHWLDLARFGESHGYEQDYDRPYAYHYRDFLIRAINGDMPFDQFTRWQIAGDEEAPNDPLALAATGFLAAGTHATQITANQVEKERYDELDDMAATTGTTFLGLTVGCARCHDHKYDPIPTADYYRLVSNFTTTVRSEIEVNLDPKGYARAKQAFDKEHSALESAVAAYEARAMPERVQAIASGTFAGASVRPEIAFLAKLPENRRTAEHAEVIKDWARVTDPNWRKLDAIVREHQAAAPKPNTTMMMVASEGLKPIRFHTQGADFFDKTFFLVRGDLNRKQAEAPPGYLRVLMRAAEAEKHWQSQPPKGWRTSYHREGLARWLCDPENGAGHVLARVAVNRVWQHYFGRGLVVTPSDFGRQGAPPSHPELLDWLAAELIRGGWRLKPIHRLILTSAVYRQDSRIDQAKAQVDVDNLLLWRQNRRRLEAEAIRDSLLFVGGALDPAMFGPGTLDEGSGRRSIYLTVKRSKLIPMMTLFDAPDTLTSLGQRSATTVAPQALMLMNNPHVRRWAEGFAKRVEKQNGALEDSIRLAYEIALGRPPMSAEIADDSAFLKTQTAAHAADGRADSSFAALADFCQVLMGLNDFIFVE